MEQRATRTKYHHIYKPKPGNYTFVIKTHRDEIKETRLKIRILPPRYDTVGLSHLYNIGRKFIAVSYSCLQLQNPSTRISQIRKSILKIWKHSINPNCALPIFPMSSVLAHTDRRPDRNPVTSANFHP